MVPEPPGVNCATGGVKITIGTSVTFVCNGAAGEDAPSCVNTRRVVAMALPSRFGKFRGVRIRINGETQRRRVLRTQNRNVPYVRVTTAGLACGVYAVIARGRGERAYPMIWTFKGGKQVVKTRIGGFHRPTPNG